MDIDKQLHKSFYSLDENAVIKVISLYKDALMLFVYSYVRNMQAAQDIVSDTFVKIMLAKKIKDQSKFKSYLFTAARNTALDYLRKNKRERKYIENLTQNTNFSADIELLLEKRNDKKIILKSIYQLKLEYQSVLLLHYYEQLSVNEISKIMRKNKKQVYNLLQRSKNALKPILLKEGINDDN